ncbi:MAG: tyrosine-type recombinase/integrase [Candidatus Paceibacterota bacterium]
MSLCRWFVWLAAENFIETDIAAKLELPKEEWRLPTDVLTAEEVESLLNTTDVTTPLGLRDRAILETFYSTAMRCGADLRSLQMLLGHERLNTTQIYTHVSIQRLKDVHQKTHPAQPNRGSDRDNHDE